MSTFHKVSLNEAMITAKGTQSISPVHITILAIEAWF
uniref:Uncharacterized protein n=1 Tax=Rhizophora mucronata TaxID=61149 RepID=A0A2P2PRF8_RHIMU